MKTKKKQNKAKIAIEKFKHKKQKMAKTKPTLEDYIFDMETRPPDNGSSNDQDLWSQLQKKESDLLLAAELGKALLEKNEELAKQQEKLIEEYSKKLEVRLKHFFFTISEYPTAVSFIYFVLHEHLLSQKQ